MLRVSDTGVVQRGSKRKKKSVNFNDVEEIINIDEIDPNVGKFRNLVQTSVIMPNKKLKIDHPTTSSDSSKATFDQKSSSFNFNNFNFNLPNSAPEVLDNFNELLSNDKPSVVNFSTDESRLKANRKKKYAKEKWIGARKQF